MASFGQVDRDILTGPPNWATRAVQNLADEGELPELSEEDKAAAQEAGLEGPWAEFDLNAALKDVLQLGEKWLLQKHANRQQRALKIGGAPGAGGGSGGSDLTELLIPAAVAAGAVFLVSRARGN